MNHNMAIPVCDRIRGSKAGLRIRPIAVDLQAAELSLNPLSCSERVKNGETPEGASVISIAPNRILKMKDTAMAEPQIRFEDGAGYERMMGTWSRLAGEVFLDWLQPASGLRWVDIGCGNGAFTELLAERCAPAGIEGIDPSEAQLAFARTRHTAGVAEFRRGDAMALPFADNGFDAAVMALVIFFVPDPAAGVAEMARVVRAGGLIASYAWDIEAGGFPLEPVLAELRAIGFPPVRPPSFAASRMENLRRLWTEAGLDRIETREIAVQRTFSDFDDFWTTALLGTTVKATVATMTPDQIERLKTQVRTRLAADHGGPITTSAFANAIKGRVPA
jgi:ubiquinone/menaquinone biosynthesis C-methylase UbiE